MPRRTDSRMRMIVAARRLYRERGYVATAFSDVLRESAAPRGSVYFHFPGGKEELGAEVAVLHAAETIAQINRSALRGRTAAELVGDFLDEARDRLVTSDFREGCAVAPIVIEAAASSEPLGQVTRRGFQDVIGVFAARLGEKGVPDPEARALATAAMAAVEGALIVSRGLRDVSAFDALRDPLTARAAAAARPSDPGGGQH
jgi:TetR/AcrR family transcriptional regulator, lmrAB and yxaGH operons repressor